MLERVGAGLVAAARAVPKVAVELDGTALRPPALDRVTGLHVRQRSNLPTACELVIAEGTGSPPIRLGMSVRVSVGTPKSSAKVLFDGEVTAVRRVYGPAAENQVRVRAYDRLHRMRKRCSVKSWQDRSVSSIASELGDGAGLRVSGAAGPSLELALQQGESDLDFLVGLAASAGLQLVVQGDTLRLFDGSGTGDVVHLRLGHGLREVHVDTSLEPALERVQAASWDLPGAALRSEDASERSGGPHVGLEIDPCGVGSDGAAYIVNAPARSADALRSLAQNRLDRAAAQAAQIWGVADGDPALAPGATVEIAGIHPDAAGTFVLTQVDHVVDDQSGFTSEFSSTPPPLPRSASPRSLMAVGRVTSTSDPESKGRVQVAFVAHQGQPSGWLPVLSTGIRDGKGLWFLPGVDDVVLVLSPSGDLGNACVAGTLPSASGPVDAGTDSEGVARTWWRTKGGNHVQLADRSDEAIVLEDANGNRVTLGAKGIRLHSAQDLIIEAPGHILYLRANAIEHERA
ncbi:MAG TPA: contractile injection system protein, VgrG/Pvc8 family [Acidimicrobiales bacterium]|nr:contractile injection system protein, VgrG/Pvc8 family [Acidimicrobiales bacterium]